MMSWRYQLVWQTDKSGDRYYSLCEVYFDTEGRLLNWTESPPISPGGESAEGLRQDLVRMLVDSYRWEAIAFADLAAGMTFQRRITPEQAEALAKMVAAARHNLKQVASVPPPVSSAAKA